MNSKLFFALAIGLVALVGGLLLIVKAPAIARYITDRPTAGRVASLRAAGCIGVAIALFAFATSPFY